MPITTGSFSMKTFMEKVKAANRSFKLNKSSLKPLIDAVGGDYDDKKGLDPRTLNLAQLKEVQGILWPQGEGNTNTPWARKKAKYSVPLGWLATQLFPVQAGDVLLVASYKTGWGDGPKTLTYPRRFVTASGARETDLNRSGGFSTAFSTELCIPADGLLGDWAWHKFVFAKPMALDKSGKLQSAGALKTQGFGANVYCFKSDAGTQYFCARDLEAVKKFVGEVAFPAPITLSYIRPFLDGAPKASPIWPVTDWDDTTGEDDDEEEVASL